MNKEIKKFYRAKVKGQPPIGQWTHYMEPSSRAPKNLSREPKPNWKKCDLIILDCAAEVKIELLTGRSHQIRSQLAYEGYAILGDRLYGGEAVAAPKYKADFFYLACQKIQLPNGNEITRPANFHS